jgi:MGT family glycosyltransferase
MGNILFASVPFSGHVHPAVPIADALIKKGHKIKWYSGTYFRNTIESVGAEFFPFIVPPDFNDGNIRDIFREIPENNHARQAIYYIKNIFFKPMNIYYEELKKINEGFNADIIVTDEWFSGAIPFAEKKEMKWVSYGNSPVMYVSKKYPGIGTGVMPDDSIYGRNRDNIIFYIQKAIFCRTQKFINKLRAEAGLPKLEDFFINHNYKLSSCYLKFNTVDFEFPVVNLPDSIKFVGPVIFDNISESQFDWEKKIDKTRPLVFLTRGSHDLADINKLIVPSIKALNEMGIPAIVSTGGKPASVIPKELYYKDLIIEEYVPYSKIMPFTDMMITNGGFGGVSTALRFGVPLIVAGNSEDKPEIASRVQYTGCGINLRTGKPSVSQIKKAVRNIIDNNSYRNVARKISRSFLDKDAVKESVAFIEGLM